MYKSFYARIMLVHINVINILSRTKNVYEYMLLFIKKFQIENEIIRVYFKCSFRVQQWKN